MKMRLLSPPLPKDDMLMTSGLLTALCAASLPIGIKVHTLHVESAARKLGISTMTLTHCKTTGNSLRILAMMLVEQMPCERMIGPYHCCSVVEGDCLELMRRLPDGCVDAVITDPPYGIDYDTDYRRFTTGFAVERKAWPKVHGDDKPFDPTPWLRFPTVILWGANHFASKLPEATWLIWDKRFPNGTAFLCDAEIAWMNKGRGAYIRSITSQGCIRPEQIQHPTQKPEELMAWCLEKAGFPELTIDPFLGSGTTAVAAAKLGRHFLGFEISPEYCRIARERIALVEAQPSLFAAKPEQQKLALDAEGAS
jgi:site-specific DNA-methyltransferase (adenine-specific)